MRPLDDSDINKVELVWILEEFPRRQAGFLSLASNEVR